MIKSFIIAASVFFIFFFFVPWKRSVIFCAIWIIFEGALRKWVLPGFHKEIYFIKDIILLTVYIKFFTIKRTSFRGRDYGLSTVKILLMSLFLWGLLEACNPELPNIFVGLFGFKQLFFYIPLIFIVPHVFNDKEKLFSYIKRYTFLFVPIAILGIRQFFAEPGSPTTTYLSWDGTTVISVVGEHTRLTGTISYISGYTAYLTVLAFLGLSLFSKGFSLTKHWAILGAYMLVVLNLLMTGARGPVVVVLIGIVIYFIAMFVKRPNVLSRWLVLAILIGVLLVFMGSTFSTAIQNIYGRGMEDKPNP